MTATIQISAGRFTIVDDEDAEWVAQFRWQYCPAGVGYVQRTVRESGRRFGVKLHRALLDAPPGIEVDHIDNDGLNNRRSNLRLATRVQNQQNVGPRADSSTGVRGVSWKKDARKFVARIQTEHRRISLGYFDTLDAAREAAISARRQMMPYSPEAREVQA